MRDFDKLKQELLKDPEIKNEYDALGEEFKLIEQIISLRIQNDLTQAELAKRIGTKQSAISRLESGSYNPTLAMLKKISEALGAKLTVSIN